MVKFNTNSKRILKYRDKKNSTSGFSGGFGEMDIVGSTISTGWNNVQKFKLQGLFYAEFFPEILDNKNPPREDHWHYHVDTNQYKATDDPKVVFEGIKKDVLAGEWELFLDDERSPLDVHCLVSGNCVVVRTVQDAIMLVDKLGMPSVMYLDYWLGHSKSPDGTIKPFLEYFYKKFVSTPDLWFEWHNHSQHEDRIFTDRFLYKMLTDNVEFSKGVKDGI